jgi:2-isopropylmalate synthase
VIEAGFPAASPGDLEAVRRIALEVEGPVICGLARAREEDIRAAWGAIRYAQRPRIHVFIATSDVHLRHKLRLSREEVLERAREMVAYARSLCPDVEFSPEDASRTDPAFLYEVLEAVIEAGATTVNIPDTVGYSIPSEFASLIRGIVESVPNIGRAVISVHCHDDLGLAVANSLAAVAAGARQVECTVNGLGERAGNAALEEVVMALAVRGDLFGLGTGINTQEIVRTSRLVGSISGISVPPNKAIVGANAFAHESGVHQDGVLKERSTYEIIDPKAVGFSKSELVLGKLSGRHALKEKLRSLGYELSDEELERVFARFKELADVKEVSEADLEAIVADELFRPAEIYKLEQVQVVCGDKGIPTATVALKAPDGRVLVDSNHGTGPVDAVYRAINRIVGEEPRLIAFTIKAITGGLDAMGEVSITVESPEVKGENGRPRLFSGQGASTDIVVASAKAYLNALNKLLAAKGGQK